MGPGTENLPQGEHGFKENSASENIFGLIGFNWLKFHKFRIRLRGSSEKLFWSDLVGFGYIDLNFISVEGGEIRITSMINWEAGGVKVMVFKRLRD